MLNLENKVKMQVSYKSLIYTDIEEITANYKYNREDNNSSSNDFNSILYNLLDTYNCNDLKETNSIIKYRIHKECD